MAIIAGVGQAQGPDGREVGVQAARQALKQFGRTPPGLAWVICAYDFSLSEVVDGVAEVLGDTPVLGFSTSGVLPHQSQSRRSVAVGLIGGEDLQVKAEWWPEFKNNSLGHAQTLSSLFQPELYPAGLLFVVADGLNGDPDQFCAGLPAGEYALAGCQAGGSLYQGRTFQAGGRQVGSGGLAAALLSGNLRVGVGTAHGWRPVGALARLSQTQGLWVRSLDGKPPGQRYAELFGLDERKWSFPPLNELVRLYPLGVQTESGVHVRSPLRMEADGSLRMNAALKSGSLAHVMVGSVGGCLEAARLASQQALDALNGAQPVFGLVLVDSAWQVLLIGQAGAEIDVVRQTLAEAMAGENGTASQGPPIIGGYTFGQFARFGHEAAPGALNQHIEVVLVGQV